MSFLLSDARQFLEDYNRSDSSARAIRNYKRIINDANLALRNFGKFDWDKRISQITFQPVYSDGTVSINFGSPNVAGVGTAFVAGMIGRYIRFAGEQLQYRILSVTNGLNLVLETNYAGGQTQQNQVNAGFQITDDSELLPAHFRDFEKPILDYADYLLPPLHPVSMQEILRYRIVERLVNVPLIYAVEWRPSAGSGVPSPYMWLYPSPAQQRIVTIAYYVWPVELAADGDDFGLPQPAENVLRELLIAYNYREQGRMSEFQAAMGSAGASAAKALANFRAVSEVGRRTEWSPESDPPDEHRKYPYPLRVGAGEPKYQ